MTHGTLPFPLLAARMAASDIWRATLAVAVVLFLSGSVGAIDLSADQAAVRFIAVTPLPCNVTIRYVSSACWPNCTTAPFDMLRFDKNITDYAAFDTQFGSILRFSRSDNMVSDEITYHFGEY